MMDFDRARRKAEERSEREFGAPTRGIFSLDASSKCIIAHRVPYRANKVRPIVWIQARPQPSNPTGRRKKDRVNEGIFNGSHQPLEVN